MTLRPPIFTIWKTSGKNSKKRCCRPLATVWTTWPPLWKTHGERLCHFIEGMISYRKKARLFRVKSFFTGLAASLVCGTAGWIGLMGLPPVAGLAPDLQIAGAGLLCTIILIFWLALIQKYLYSRFLKKWLRQIDKLTPLPQPDPP